MQRAKTASKSKKRTKLNITIIISAIVMILLTFQLTMLAMNDYTDYDTPTPPSNETPSEPPTNDGYNQNNELQPTPEPTPTPTPAPNVREVDRGSGSGNNNQNNDTHEEEPISDPSESTNGNNGNNGGNRPTNLGASYSERGNHIQYTAYDFEELQEVIAGMSVTNSYTVYVSDMLMTSEIIIPIKADITITNEHNQANLIMATEDERHFIVYGTLRLHGNVVLEGIDDPTFNHGGIEITYGGHLLMTGNEYGGSLIIGNTADTGGGVNVNAGGRLTVYNGSAIIGNIANVGGGVNIETGGTFIMYGGDIWSNTASEQGGGVAVFGGELVMYDGDIFGNISNWGGGVAVWNSTFTMHDGLISGNSANEDGGGVGLRAQSNFTMYSGQIAYNFAYDDIAEAIGGGVLIQESEFIMHDGEISNNLSFMGGNIAVQDGLFTMYDGAVSYGAANINGGVFYDDDSAFILNNGDIFNNFEFADSGEPRRIVDAITDHYEYFMVTNIEAITNVEMAALFSTHNTTEFSSGDYVIINHTLEGMFFESGYIVHSANSKNRLIQSLNANGDFGISSIVLLFALVMLPLAVVKGYRMWTSYSCDDIATK